MQVQEKEKMYIELRQILARQPGPELTEQLSEYKRAIKQKVKQLKTLTAELNMAESAQQAQDMDIQRLANELQVKFFKIFFFIFFQIWILIKSDIYNHFLRT